MGSDINIGIVYDNKQKGKINFYLSEVIKLLINNFGTIKFLRYSKDKDGTKWIEQEQKQLDSKKTKLLTTNYYGKVELASDVFGKNLIETVVSIEQTDSYFGFLIQFNEQELSENLTIWEVENLIIDFVLQNQNTLEFQYAFCDHEGEMEYTHDEMKNITEEIYSLLFIPSDNTGNMKVLKSRWALDGLTNR